jgi:hypothetical protein
LEMSFFCVKIFFRALSKKNPNTRKERVGRLTMALGENAGRDIIIIS